MSSSSFQYEFYLAITPSCSPSLSNPRSLLASPSGAEGDLFQLVYNLGLLANVLNLDKTPSNSWSPSVSDFLKSQRSPSVSDFPQRRQPPQSNLPTSSNTILLDLRQKLKSSGDHLTREKMLEPKGEKGRVVVEKGERLISPVKPKARWPYGDASPANSRVEGPSSAELTSFQAEFLTKFIRVLKLFEETLTPSKEAEILRALYSLDDDGDFPGTVYLTKWVIPQESLKVRPSTIFIFISILSS